MTVVEVWPAGRAPTVIVWVVPFGRVMTALTVWAVLGPALVITTVAVMVWPGVALAGAVMLIATSDTGETVSTSAAVQVPEAQEGEELVLVTLTGGDMTPELVTCVCAWAAETHTRRNANESATDPANWRTQPKLRNGDVKEQAALEVNKKAF